MKYGFTQFIFLVNLKHHPACLFPLLFDFCRRSPRKKSLRERTSSRYSSIIDSETTDQYPLSILMSNLNSRTRSNQVDHIETKLRCEHEMIVGANEHDDSTTSLDHHDSDDDEYACLILNICCRCSHSFSLFTITAEDCSAWMLRSIIIDFYLPRRKPRDKSVNPDRQSIRKSLFCSSQSSLSIFNKPQEV